MQNTSPNTFAGLKVCCGIISRMKQHKKHNANVCTLDQLNLKQRVEVMGSPVDPWTMEETVAATDAFIQNGAFAHLIGVNADKLLQMKDDANMSACVRKCEIVNADGASMVMAAKKLGVEIPERVSGIDLMAELCKLAEEKSYGVFLLGAKQNVVQKTAEVLLDRHPNLPIVGFRDGYFNEDEFDDIIEEVTSTNPNIVFVGITSPKKEKLIERFREKGAAGAFVGVGGSFDVISGNIPRAPMWMQKANLEWLFRMMQEPTRLFKRYAVGNTRFYLMMRKEVKKAQANA